MHRRNVIRHPFPACEPNRFLGLTMHRKVAYISRRHVIRQT
ncbi:hypothetical protein [uncultured Veillonella sp.]|nr:hypothetical protein [uncultured Veillonella sp.]